MSDNNQSVVQTLTWARRNGFKPVLLHPKSKAAVSRDYVEPGYRPPSDEAWMGGKYGVGVVTGPMASGPIDIDLDCEEAVKLAPRFLPKTQAVFGRASKPNSHYVYTVDLESVQKVAYLDPVTTKTLVELRADGGHQTVFPGSIHDKTGETIEWSFVPFPEVTKVPFTDLELAVKKLAVACLITRHAWLPGQRNEACKHIAGMFYHLGWTVEDAQAVVAAACDFWEDTDKTRAMTVRNTYKKAEAGGRVTGAKSLSKLLGEDKTVGRILSWFASGGSSVVSEFNEVYAVVDYSGKFRIASVDVPKGQIPTFYTKDDFMALKGADYIEIEGKPVSKPKIWVASPRRRSCTSVDFLPGQEETGTTLNLWTGWGVDPDPDTSKCEGWLELLGDYICGKDKALTAWMLHWFANIVREPTNKSLTAPVIIGSQGAGKSLMVGYVGRMLGSAFVTVTNPEHLYGKFNAHTATCLLMHSDEALFGGEKKHRGIIKSLITDETRVFETKGVDAKIVKNHMRLIMTSNEPHAAPAEVGDRRFTVIDLRKRKIPPALVRKVVKEIRSGGPASLLHYFLNIEYDPELPRTNVKNDALEGMKSIGLSPIDEWWRELLMSGQLLPDFLAWSLKPDKEEWPACVGSITLYKWAIETMKGQGIRSLPSPNAFYLQLAKLCDVKLRKERRSFTNPGMGDGGFPNWVNMLPERQTAILNIPGLAKCRRAFEKHVGQKIEWPGDEPDHEKPVYERY